jgi:hypothetical protein
MEKIEAATTDLLVKCTRQLVQVVGRKLKSHSSRMEQDLFTVGNATKRKTQEGIK